jgi:general secretion pathway protein F
MAVMLRAGLQLDRALRIQRGMSVNPVFARLLDDVLRSIKRGESLSEALAPHLRLFGEFYVNMVRSGEVSGRLGEVMQRLSEHLERVKVLRENAVSALIYPSILLVVAVLSLVLLLGFVVPQFEALFVEMGEALPAPTRIVVGAGHAVAEWGWLIALVVLLLALGARKWLSTPAGRSWWDRRLLALPVIGPVMRKFEISRFARSMGTLLAGGVPIVVAIRIAADTVASRSLRAAINEVVPQIKQGNRVADALERLGEFSPLALNMVRVGEETGQLDGMLLELARVYDAEVQSGIKRALTLVEPLVILLLGGIIAAIIVSILMGILAVNDLVV